MYNELVSALYSRLGDKNPRALECVVKQKRFPRNSEYERDYNAVVSILYMEAAKRVGQDGLNTGDLLGALAWADKFQPVTRETDRRKAPQEYREARISRDGLLKGITLRMPRHVEGLLDERLKRLIWRYRTLALSPEAWIATLVRHEDRPYHVCLERSDDGDRWHAKAGLPDGTDVIHPIWLATGHISHRGLMVRASVSEAVPEPGLVLPTLVLSVLVLHRRGYRCRLEEECPLPAATELVIPDDRRPRWSAWAEQVSPTEALLPHVGPIIRLGNHIISPEPKAPRVRRRGWIKTGTGGVWFRPRPESVWVHERQGDVRYVRLPKRCRPIAGHPDHYMGQLTQPTQWVRLQDARGKTQYIPSALGGD